jgi:hypothetical protein
LTQRHPELKSLGLTIALVRIILRSYPWSLLPPRVVAELELNSVNPPPDTIEEEKKENPLRIASLTGSRVSLQSTQSEA